MICKGCGNYCSANDKECPVCGKILNETISEGNIIDKYKGDEAGRYLPMKWHKAVIYVLLFLTMISYVINGFKQIIFHDDIYNYLGGLQILDRITGVLCLGMAVFALVTRQALAEYKENAIKLYMGLLLADVAISIGYAVIFVLILKNSEYGAGAEGYEIIATYIRRMIGIIVIRLIYIGLNSAYYQKRKCQFEY